MPSRRRKALTSISVKTAELAYTVPQVVAHRVARMAISGSVLSPRDRKEFRGMVAEKHTAFQQSSQAMFKEACRLHQRLTAQVAKSMFQPLDLKNSTPQCVASRAQAATLSIASKGLDPVHRKAKANAKRLARTKLIEW